MYINWETCKKIFCLNCLIQQENQSKNFTFQNVNDSKCKIWNVKVQQNNHHGQFIVLPEKIITENINIYLLGWICSCTYMWIVPTYL